MATAREEGEGEHVNYELLGPKVAEIDAATPGLTDQQVADAINAETVATLVSRFVTYRTLLAELPLEQALTVIGKLKAAAASDETPATIKAVLEVVDPSLADTASGTGIDLSNGNARSFLDGLVQATILTAEECDAVKALAEQTQSWADANGCSGLEARHVADARVINGEGA